MTTFTIMRLSRVQDFLDAEPMFKKEMAASKLLVSSCSGIATDEVTLFSIRVCRAIINQGFDPRNVERAVIIACASRVMNHEIKVSADLPPSIKLRQKRHIQEREAAGMKTEEFLKDRHTVVVKAIKAIDDNINELSDQRHDLEMERAQVSVLLRMYSEGRMGELGELIAKVPEADRPAAQADPPVADPPVAQADPPAAPEPIATENLPSPRQWYDHIELLRFRITEVLTALKNAGTFRLCDFNKLWGCDRSCVYIREFAKAMPYSRPLLMEDGITFSAGAGQAEICAVADAICQVPWPKYISKCTFLQVSNLAVNAIKIVNSRRFRRFGAAVLQQQQQKLDEAKESAPE